MYNSNRIENFRALAAATFLVRIADLKISRYRKELLYLDLLLQYDLRRKGIET